MSDLTLTTRAPEAVAPMLTSRTSPVGPKQRLASVSLETIKQRDERGLRVEGEEMKRTLCKLCNLSCLLLTLRPHSQKPPQHEALHLQLRIDIHPLSNVAQHVPNQPVGPAHGRVNLGSNSDETSRNGKREVVVLGKEGDDLGPDWRALERSGVVLGDEPRSDLDLLLQLFVPPNKKGTKPKASVPSQMKRTQEYLAVAEVSKKAEGEGGKEQRGRDARAEHRSKSTHPQLHP